MAMIPAMPEAPEMERAQTSPCSPGERSDRTSLSPDPRSDSKERIRDYYNDHANVYEIKHGLSGAGQQYNFERYYEPFLRRWLVPGVRVLELGCGTGAYTRILSKLGCDVVGMDISPAILAEARGNCPAARFCEGDCEDPAAHLPSGMPSAGFDAIVGINTFSYYPNKLASLQRYRELLVGGGRLILLDMNGRCPFYRVMCWLNKNEMRAWHREIRDCRASTLRTMLDRARMRLREQVHFAFIPNGVPAAAVGLLRPLDVLLSSTPLIRSFAMRVGVVAERP